MRLAVLLLMSVGACSCGKAYYMSDGGFMDSAKDLPSDVPFDLPSDLPSDVPSDLPSDVPSDYRIFSEPRSKCYSVTADQVESSFPSQDELPRVYGSGAAGYDHFGCSKMWVLELPAPKSFSFNIRPVFQEAGDQPPANCDNLRAIVHVWGAAYKGMGFSVWEHLGALSLRGELETVQGLPYCLRKPISDAQDKVWVVPTYDKIRIAATAHLDGDPLGSLPVTVELSLL